MSDVRVVRYLLANDAGLTAVVSPSNIMGGPLPENIALPAISVQHLSTLRHNYVAETLVDWCTSRVQVTVFARTYPEVKSTLKLVRAALPRSRGVVAGVEVDAILSDLEGPDFYDGQTGVYQASHDFQVTFNE